MVSKAEKLKKLKELQQQVEDEKWISINNLFTDQRVNKLIVEYTGKYQKVETRFGGSHSFDVKILEGHLIEADPRGTGMLDLPINDYNGKNGRLMTGSKTIMKMFHEIFEKGDKLTLEKDGAEEKSSWVINYV